MEKPKTQLELRKEAFDNQAELCRAMADYALANIDEALDDDEARLTQDEVWASLAHDVAEGWITQEQADEAMAAYRNGLELKPPKPV